MLKYNQKCLTILLKVISIATFVNLSVVYWLPITFPISSFSAVRIVVIAFIDKQYQLIPMGVLICVFLFLTPFSIRRKNILLPVLTIIYLIFDFIIVLSLIIDGLYDGYWRMYIIQALLPIALIVLLCINLSHRTGDGLRAGQGD